MIPINQHRLELLAPCGKRDVLEAVIDAGADAVYLGTKRFNMRMHRSDFHFDSEGLAGAVNYAHERSVSVYVTLNNLIGTDELDDVARLLEELDTLNVDAIIIQDLGTLKLARELGCTRPLHASTQMNVHSPEMAGLLKQLGICRVITSRDIPLHEVRRIRHEADIEVEIFLHGDMCVAQSGQCLTSALAFHKSANRGECMKPCRWDYELVDLKTSRRVGNVDGGHVLAINDLSLFRQIPELVQNEVTCLKIEGRMREAAYLHHLVSLYRLAIDTYYEAPFAWYARSAELERLHNKRIRDMSTLLSFAKSNDSMFSHSGRREPLVLSAGKQEARNAFPDEPGVVPLRVTPQVVNDVVPVPEHVPELVVTVASPTAVPAALAAGADRIDIAWERPQRPECTWLPAQVIEAIRQCHDAECQLALRTPRVTTAREMAEVHWLLECLNTTPPDCVLVHNLGTLAAVQQHGLSIIADWGLNILNPESMAALHELGVERFTASVESSFEDLRHLSRNACLPLEVVAHGALEGMLIDHCLYALALTKARSKDVCRAPCQHVRLGLRDAAGEVRPVEVDQYCRNHILTGVDLCTAGYLPAFVSLAPAALRLECQYFDSAAVGAVTGVYRRQLDALHDLTAAQLTQQDRHLLEQASPRGMGLAAYGGNIVHSISTARVMREKSLAVPGGSR